MTLATGPACAGPARNDIVSALAKGTPWQAEIYTGYRYSDAERKGRPQWDKAHRCGGSYIAPHWILTAAHCFYKKGTEDRIPWQENGWRIRLGARNLANGEGVSFLIDEVKVHPGFVHATYTNDVALVHFVADSESQADGARRNGVHVAKIRLNGTAPGDRPLELGEAVAVTGWGKTEANDDAPTQARINEAKLYVVDCQWDVYKDRTTGDNFCAFDKGKDACQGDSGGPMIRSRGQPVLVGIVSWGDSCGKHGGVYARVDREHFLPWILKEAGMEPAATAD